jgi:4-carboxymuconolactone decarboxylase
MTSSNNSLGGRLALLTPDDLSASQREFYTLLQTSVLPWAKQSGFQAETDAHELIGPFNAMLRSPEISKAMMGLTGVESQHSSLDERVQQVVILTVGAVWQASYELYAHTAVARKAGMSEEAIQALVAGQRPDGLSQKETLAYDFTRQLVTTHKINSDLYQQSIETFGEKGMLDMLILAGEYMTISALLNTFVVPAPVS